MDEINIRNEFNNAFMTSCYVGHIEIAKWLYSLGVINIHMNNDYAFRNSCGKGHIEIAKWLYSLDAIDISINDNYAFKWSCYNGKLNVVKWLYSLGININKCNEYMIIKVCINGHKNIIKWLHGLHEENIQKMINNALIWSFKHKRNEITQWLQKFCFDYEIITETNKINLRKKYSSNKNANE